MIGQVTPIAITAIGWRFYVIFIVCNAVNGVFFWAFLPETKGLNLEDMDELFRDSPTFVPGSKWQPSSHIDADAETVAEQELRLGLGKAGWNESSEHVENTKGGGLD